MKLTVNVDDELIKRVDQFAKDNYINRTSALAVLLTRALQANDVSESVIAMKDMWDSFKQMNADTQIAEK